MKVNKKRLQMLISAVFGVVLLLFVVVVGGGELLSDARHDLRVYERIVSIESKTGKIVGQVGRELDQFCDGDSEKKASERVAAMSANTEKLEKSLGLKSLSKKDFSREYDALKAKALSDCMRASDVYGVRYVDFEISGDVFKEKLFSKWFKLLFSSVLSIILVVLSAWLVGLVFVRTIPYLFRRFFNGIKFFFRWITEPEK
ncbi:hypothetical protein ACTXOX_02385 [Pseudomonas helleri]|uniref:hypothetical protein n=1 Tax=Pseudomonas helleri TaxID=1608996 RepID=UPI003FD280F7